jgi:hypothetical protein
MVLQFCCKLEGMRGPHSKHRLAIQLSKTERHRSNRVSWIRTLATAGSRRRPCWFKSGRRNTRGAPCCQEGVFYRKLRRPSDRRCRRSTPGLLSRQASPARSRGAVRFEEGRFYPPSGFPVKCQVRLPVPSACEGRAM